MNVVAELVAGERKRNWLVEGFDPGKEAFTWDLRHETVKELNRLESQFHARGLNPLLGLEIEIGTSGVEQSTLASEELRKTLIGKLTGKGTKDSESEMRFLQSATALDLAVYQLYKSDVGKYLNPEFTDTWDPKCLYDARKVLELKTIPAAPKEINTIRTSIISEFRQQVIALNLAEKLKNYPSYHLNFSFKDSNGNLFDENHPDFATRGKALAEGISYALSKSMILTHGLVDYADNIQAPHVLSVSRGTGIRFTHGRTEVKYQNEDGAEQDPDLLAVISLSGALYGYDNMNNGSDIKKAHIVESPVTENIDERLKVLSHALNGSYLSGEGSLVVDRDYINEKLHTILYEIGYSESLPELNYFTAIIDSLTGDEEFEPLIKFLSGIKVARMGDEIKLVFPGENGKFEFIVPEVGMERLPTEIKEKVRNGGSITEEEAERYLIPGQRMPQKEIRKLIDTDKLQKGLELRGLSKEFMVKPAPSNEQYLSRGKEIAWNRFNKIRKAKNLNYLNPIYKLRLMFKVWERTKKAATLFKTFH